MAGVVPLENDDGSSVYEVYDLLISHNLYINASHIEKVNHCLACVPGAGMEEIREVYSHPQALAQSEEFLRRYGLAERERSNTAVAAKEVADLNDRSIGAICSREAACLYGLTILQEGINHNKENAINLLRSKHLIVNDAHDKIAVVFACPRTEAQPCRCPRHIWGLRGKPHEIHSRPDGKKRGEYLVLTLTLPQSQGCKYRALLYQLHEELPYIKPIGSYESKA